MKKILSALLAVLLLFSFAGCSNNGGKTGEKTKVTFWHTLTDHDEEMVQEIVDAFNASQDKWEVVQQTQTLEGFEAKVYSSVTEGTGPSLVWLYPNTAQDYVNAGLALDFGKYFADADYKDRVSEGVYAASTEFADGKLHAIACTVTGSIMFYNSKLLEKYNIDKDAIKTWDDLLAACKTVVDGERAEGGVLKDIIGFGPDSVDTLGIVTLQQLGLNFINKDKTVTDWTNQKFADWINFWKEAEAGGYFKLVDDAGYHSGPYGSWQYFSYMGSSAGLGYITPQEKEGYGTFDIVTGPVPQIAGGKEYAEITVRALVGFTKDDKTDEGAAEFAKFFTKAENNVKFVQKYSAATPFKDVESSPEYKDYFEKSVAQQALAAMMPITGTRISVAGASGCKEAMIQTLKTIIVSGADVAETLKAQQEAANTALKDAQ
ncbi:MAG: extracellular solute-binding protein [Erysipelotrichaceae bacterium]|nr:extracellular solute-binding protein [Erysipelotrichaceae bacterium]